jgi:phage major head subunit gpT-like protein
VHETIALAFALTEEAEEDNLYGSIGQKYSRALARSMQHTKEVKGAATLNNGFSATYPGGDGVALFETAHPLFGGGTQANTFSTQADLSETSLEEACIAISRFVDERGIPIACRVKKLIIPPDLMFIAERLLMSPYRPGSADNDINAVKSTGMVPGGASQNHRLTDVNAWFLITDQPDGLKHMVRKNIQRGLEGDFETGNMRYKARERYSFGWSDYRGAFGSSGNT